MSRAVTLTLCTAICDGDLARLRALVDELVRLKPDVMVTSNTQAAIAARHATAVIPIVAMNVTDPVAFGLVASHAQPGGNVTGILATLDTLPEKQLALAAEIVRGAAKMGMLLNAGFKAHAIQRKGVEVPPQRWRSSSCRSRSGCRMISTLHSSSWRANASKRACASGPDVPH